MLCNHPYVKRLAPDAFVCLDCGTVIKPEGKVYETGPLSMPPFVFQLTEQYWKDRNPWPSITREMALKYHWYGSMIYNREYLVMPVYDHAISSEPVFYSARCLTECGRSDINMFVAPKYSTPENRKRVMWKSWEFETLEATVETWADAVEAYLNSKRYILVGEGVADAVWLSQIGPSVALLGSHGELTQPFILVLDGDERGINAAFQIAQDAKRAGLVDAKTVTLPPGADPTDVSVKELIEMIYEQTGVKF